MESTGKIRSCGCLHKEILSEVKTTHGQTNTPEYDAWTRLKQRCYNEKDPEYHRYGDRGITVCDEWKESFEAFYRDMGPRPSPEHSIDRIENDKGYYKGNCRWATKVEQANNRRSNLVYEFDGEKKTLMAWCLELDLDYSAVHRRIKTQGKSFEQAIDEVIRSKK